jgi:hypothetical protein
MKRQRNCSAELHSAVSQIFYLQRVDNVRGTELLPTPPHLAKRPGLRWPSTAFRRKRSVGSICQPLPRPVAFKSTRGQAQSKSRRSTLIIHRSTTTRRSSPVVRPAECNSAIRQIKNLRYLVGSAELHSAVSQIFNLQRVDNVRGTELLPTPPHLAKRPGLRWPSTAFRRKRSVGSICQPLPRPVAFESTRGQAQSKSRRSTLILDRSTTNRRSSPVVRPAECNSAIRQIKNLRYEVQP